MKTPLLILPALILLFTSCIKDTGQGVIMKSQINGVVQKGPFINGASIEIFELGDDFSATGKAFSSQIMDNGGTFQLRNVSLQSNYVQLKADGYYFNEITNQNSNAPITLYAFSNITDRSAVNVNILSHLEKSRIEYLLSDGMNYPDAKKRAEREILRIFSISKSDVTDFDALDISEEGDDNAILLAISLIAQGFRSESELSDLLANMITDIRQDGVLNSASLGSLLINDARLLDLPKIRENIELRYSKLGVSAVIPCFEPYIKTFIDSARYQITNVIEYPEFSDYGENILYADKTEFSSGVSLAANLPKGTSLKIVIKGGIWYYQTAPNAPVNWTISAYDSQLEQQTFTAKESGKSCDLVMDLGSGTHTIDFFENASATPTRSKTVTSAGRDRPR